MTGIAYLRKRQPRLIPPAVGPGAWITGRSLVVRLLILGLLVGLAGAALAMKTVSGREAGTLPPLPGAARVTDQVIRGGQPADFDLLQLRDAYRVRAVVNLRLDGDAEGPIARSFGLAFLDLPVADGEPPSTSDLAALIGFVRGYRGADMVYVHDDLGGNRVITVAVMLRLLRGESLGDAMSDLQPEEEKQLSSRQWTAIVAMSQALTGGARQATNDYRNAGALRW